jgi:hypothetical protein
MIRDQKELSSAHFFLGIYKNFPCAVLAIYPPVTMEHGRMLMEFSIIIICSLQNVKNATQSPY